MKYLRRGIWFVASRLLVLTLVLCIIVVAFYYGMNYANIQVVIKDGMARRAQVAMMNENVSELNKYFQSSFIEQDPVVIAVKTGASPYKNYNIRGIDHRIEMGFLWVWPWEDTVRVDITERIPRIDGRAKGSKADELVAAGGENAVYPPAWQNGKYRATLVKENGSWKIRSLSLYNYISD